MQSKICIFLLCLSIILAQVLTYQEPEQAVVFSKARRHAVPIGWKRYSRRSLRTYGLKKRLIRLSSKPTEFQYHLQAERFAYVVKVKSRGSYLVRLGFAEHRNCEVEKRTVSFFVNEIEIPPFDIASEVGCNAPVYRDVLVEIRRKKRIVVSAKRLSVFDPPILSNIAIFRQSHPSFPSPKAISSTSPAVSLFVSSSPSTTSTSVMLESTGPSASPTTTPSQINNSSASPSSTLSHSTVSSSSFTSTLSVSTRPSSSSTTTPSQTNSPFVSPSSTLSHSAVSSSSVTNTLSVSTRPSSNPSSTPTQSQSPIIELSEVTVNVGVDVWPLSEGNMFERITRAGNIDVSNLDPGVPVDVFDTAVQGQFFNLSFPLSVGTYDATLGFAEYDVRNCIGAGRTFAVYANGVLKLESVDIFNLASGCRRAVTVFLPGLAVEEFGKRPLVLAFQGVSAPAILSYVSIKRSDTQCMPVSGDISLRDDHLAHAVPGKYPPNGDSSYVDHQGAGFVRVHIDGRQSHTHFFSNGRAGHIRRYTWTNLETAEIVSRSSNFWHKFPRGTTRMRLSILDEVCSTDVADFSVTVTGNQQTGAYCYYYKDLDGVPLAGTLGKEEHWPIHAYVQRTLRFGFPTFWFSRTKFSTRCTFSMDVTEVSEETLMSVISKGSGRAQLYKSGGLVYDTETSPGDASGIPLAIGVHEFELLYFREDLSQDGFLQVLFDNDEPPNIFYDQLSIVPLVLKVSPDGGRVDGNEVVTIVGFGLHFPLTVYFGDVSADVLAEGASSTRVQVRAPGVEDERSVFVSVVSATGIRSNAVVYTYGVDCDEIVFETQDLTIADEEKVDVGAATCVTTWLDGSLYIGSYDGYVRVVHYDLDTLRASSICQSERMTDDRFKDATGEPSLRTILGIAFDPRDVTIPLPYISTSTLFWDRQNAIANIPSNEKWANGAVERLKAISEPLLKTDGSICLAYDKRIVSNLPVSDGDHSVNALLFSQTGDLLIAVGGFTNAGLPYMSAGGNWETLLSGAVIRARLSKGEAYDGDIVHAPKDNLRTARIVKGDVDIYATGFRNLYSLVMTRTGEIYGVDMGPNCKMGNASSACDEYDESEASQRDTSSRVGFPGRLKTSVDDGCTSGVARDDKLVRIVHGGYYGHPNLQRSKLENVSECGWIDPITDTIPWPLFARAPSNYVRPECLVKSAMTAVIPYGSKAFCARLRGSLLLGLYKAFGVFRTRSADSDGGMRGTERIANGGGISGVENVVGDVVFVSNVKGSISVMRPNSKSSRKAEWFVLNALPVRLPRNGGSRLTLGGWGLDRNVSVFIASQACPVVRVTSSMIECITPPFVGTLGEESVDVKVVAHSRSNSEKESVQVLTEGVLYMQS